MKRILRHLIIDSLTLLAVSLFTQGLVFQEGLKTLLLAGAGLTVASLVVKPVINILLLPLNLLTFNLFKWISSAVALFLVTLVVPGFKVLAFIFEGYSTPWFGLPAISVEGVLAYILFSFFISLTGGLFYWLVT